MPSVIASGLSVSVEFKAQYVSAALNSKQVASPRGIVRGGYVVPSANPDEVVLTVDPITGDTVVNAFGMESITGSTPYAVTFRLNADLPIAIAADNALHFIYFLGGYSPLATTNAQLVDYSEAEFEAGTPDAAGGVLLAVVKANAVAGSVIAPAKVMTAGMSNTLYKPFKRALVSDYDGAQGFQGVRERVLTQMNFGYNRGLQVNYAQTTAFSAVGSALDVRDVDTPVGNGALHYQPAADAGLSSRAISLVSDTFLIPNSVSLPRKVRIEMVYRTDGGYVPNAASTIVVGAIRADGVPISITLPAYAPVADWPVADTGGQWALWVFEVDIPQDSGLGVTLASLYINPYFYLQSGWIEIAAITVVGFEEVGDPTELLRADAASAAPASYGVVATAPDRLRQQPQVGLSGIRLMNPHDANIGWTLRQYASQRIPSASASLQTLYIAPNSVNTATRLYIGAAGVTDLKTPTPENRYSGLTIYGAGVGTTTYTTELAGSPLRVDDIRPYAGIGGNTSRIDLRSTTGSAATPTYFSSSGTASATCVVQYNGAVWALVGSASAFVNIASIADLGLAVQFTFATALQSINTSIPFATYYGAGDYFAKINTFTTAACTMLLVDATGASSLSAGDRIYFTVIGRIS